MIEKDKYFAFKCKNKSRSVLEFRKFIRETSDLIYGQVVNTFEYVLVGPSWPHLLVTNSMCIVSWLNNTCFVRVQGTTFIFFPESEQSRLPNFLKKVPTLKLFDPKFNS